jgi:cytochrome b6-f complex iron-sulfur subunit
MRFGRRRFLAVGAAAVCIGCTGGDDGDAIDSDGGLDRFGERIRVGPAEDVRDQIAGGSGAMYVAEARSWIVPGVGDDDFLAIYQKCTHLGCRIPWCASSKRFECPCHGAVFNRIGELVDGPAARGLDRFPVDVGADGQVVIDTTQLDEGPAREVLTVPGDPAGPVCAAPG